MRYGRYPTLKEKKSDILPSYAQDFWYASKAIVEDSRAISYNNKTKLCMYTVLTSVLRSRSVFYQLLFFLADSGSIKK